MKNVTFAFMMVYVYIGEGFCLYVFDVYLINMIFQEGNEASTSVIFDIYNDIGYNNTVDLT